MSYEFQFTTVNTNPTTFLYNNGPIAKVTDATWNRKQTYKLSRIDHSTGTTTVLGSGIPCPPCNIGPFSTPNYSGANGLVSQCIKSVSQGGFSAKTFAGQRAEGFYIDLGAVFDLGDLRPFQSLHNTFGGMGLMKNMPGVNSTDAVNVHSLALQVPITDVVAPGGAPTNPSAANAVIGVWTSATRPALAIHQDVNNGGGVSTIGAPVQVSRLANPLVNELLIALANKDLWNANVPAGDGGPTFLPRFQHPELASLLPVLYPGNTFKNLAAFNATGAVRNDIVAVFLTGIPAGVVPNFPGNHLSNGAMADELRLNVAIPPATAANQSNLGLLGGDNAGFPNGRRVFDDVATIDLRAVAGAILGLTNTGYVPDAAAGLVNFGLTDGATKANQYEGDDGKDVTAHGTEFFLTTFPYLGTPHAGYDAHTVHAVNGGSVNVY
ncbi:MAG: DUF4331 domain-containing protein [Acidimicrobiales bacterium]